MNENVIQRLDAEARAAATPLPGPAGDAFASGPIKVGDKEVRKIVKYDWRVWQMTKNAIVLAMAELSKPEDERKTVDDDESQAVAVWMLTHTPREVEAALKAGVEEFKARCVRETEMELEGHEFAPLFDAVMEQVRRSALTAIKYAAKESEGEAVPINFQQPDGSKTASAG
jgi:hypothetical protein